MTAPQLSIIVPTLNEAENLPWLLKDLAAQQGVRFEVLISDGGSEDLTCSLATRFLVESNIPHRVFSGPAGRGRQMNLATAAARADWLLFLHADCRIYDSSLLRKGLELLSQACPKEGICRVAGHFCLRFDLAEDQRKLGYYFYEAKARLHEAGCTHGDQGFLLSKEFFAEVGPYRQDLPVMEDTALAEVIRSAGSWLLLPFEIFTSARRFQVEGLVERQTLNALLMNFLFIGWEDFLRHAPAIYRQQSGAEHLNLEPFRREIVRLLRTLPLNRRYQLWYATGGYVRSQAWQLVFLREVRDRFRSGDPVSAVSARKTRRFNQWYQMLTNNFVGNAIAALLTWSWFALKFGRGRARS